MRLLFRFLVPVLLLIAAPAWAAPADLIAKAYEYGIPAFEAARLRYNFSYGVPARAPVNAFGHRRALSDASDHLVTTPNNDTLYSSAILDLTAGPLTLTMPAFGARYYSIAFIDAYTNNFAYLGTRMNDRDGGMWIIAGPDWKGTPPPGAKVIRAPGNHVSALMRILVDGPSDLAEIYRLQDAVTLAGPLPPARPDLIKPVPGDAENFVAVVNQVLADDPPPANDAPVLKEIAAAGIGPHAPALTEEQRGWWKDNFAAARARIITASKTIGTMVQGWQYLPADTGNFGSDYPTRAEIALVGATANIPAESTYNLTFVDASGAALDAGHHYRLHLPAGAPPMDGFWSLSIYEVMPNGAMFFGANSINRYAIGNRTPGLERNPDGSLDILIQKDQPASTANWLPVPAGKFALIMRAYLPRPALLDGNFRYPGVARLD